MADMVTCTLAVRGQQADIDRFVTERCSSLGMIDFNLILPVQGGEAPVIVENKAIDFLGWMPVHPEAFAHAWGTRTNPARYHEAGCDDERVESSPGQIVFEFRTALTPPIIVLQVACRQYPELRFILDYFGEIGTEAEDDQRIPFSPLNMAAEAWALLEKAVNSDPNTKGRPSDEGKRHILESQGAFLGEFYEPPSCKPHVSGNFSLTKFWEWQSTIWGIELTLQEANPRVFQVDTGAFIKDLIALQPIPEGAQRLNDGRIEWSREPGDS